MTLLKRWLAPSAIMLILALVGCQSSDSPNTLGGRGPVGQSAADCRLSTPIFVASQNPLLEWKSITLTDVTFSQGASTGSTTLEIFRIQAGATGYLGARVDQGGPMGSFGGGRPAASRSVGFGRAPRNGARVTGTSQTSGARSVFTTREETPGVAGATELYLVIENREITALRLTVAGQTGGTETLCLTGAKLN